ncbi:dermonecrotic toxin domain-containing protein [Luteibacter sp.]|uniref:dermonecrotic toxin domain-containing protein n=1 Tax=Luteibacter sp. TaxID=1886636 RepID=UPI002F42AF32
MLTAAAMMPGTHAGASVSVMVPPPDQPSPLPAQLPFTTVADAQTFHGMAIRALSSPAPDARKVARELIKQQLGVDGDEYVVAHFATREDRAQGKPDHTLSLTSATMEAFPEHARHAFFAGLSDAVGGVNAGGSESPGVVSFVEGAARSKGAGEFFRKVGGFLWSRTGPGYVYNTFFADGNVIETVGEDARPLDEAFGIYRVGGFSADHASPLLLSRVADALSELGLFAELPYVKMLDGELDRYWEENRANWPVLARYAFVQQARRARDLGVLTHDQYRRVMSGGAPQVPLNGPVTLDQLRSGIPDRSVAIRRFDINGYAASNLVRFLDADGGEVMYIPGGDPVFVVAKSENELRQWVLDQAKDAKKLDALLSRFSIYNSQDSAFWTGVKRGLENIGKGTWKADDDSAVDHGNAAIDGDVFDDMRTQTENRLRDDARMQASTAWDAWRARINRAATVVGPLGYIPVLAIPIQVGTGIVGVGSGIDQGIHGRTEAERTSGLEQAAMTVVTNIPLAGAFGKGRGAAVDMPPGAEGERPSFNPPERVNGGIGYPLSPTRPPGLPLEGSVLARVLPDGITTDPKVLNRAAQIMEQFGSTETMLPTLPSAGAGANPSGSMVMMSVGHGFIETVSARLRNPAAKAWSLLEIQLIAPIMVERTGKPLAVFDGAGKFAFAVLPDGSDVTPELLPATALRLQRRGDDYVLLNRNSQATRHTYRSIFAAMEESVRPSRDAHELDDTRLERDFRSMLADSIDARSTRPELERMHRLWVDPMRLPDRQKQLIKDLSSLRHALVDRHETLTAAQKHTLLDARTDPDDASSSATGIDARAIDDGVLARIADRWSALLPAGLDYLVVKDPAILEQARNQAADEWTVDHRDYVRLRHLDGRTQIVETNPGQGAGTREILAPGSHTDRTTGRQLVNTDGLWYPEPWLREGFAPIDPREQVAAAEAIAAKLPVSAREDHEAIARIVDSIPQPLLRFFDKSLAAIDVAADGRLVLRVRHVESGQPMSYLTHVDVHGWPGPRAPAGAVPQESSVPFAADRQLVLPVLRGTRSTASGSTANPDPRAYIEILRSERPVSEFIARGVGDRHISALVNTRRLRGMLREDANVALVGATPDHALTLILPANAETMRLTGPERNSGRLVGDLPSGTIIADNLYQVSTPAGEYPSLVREIALEWEASGNRMARIMPDGREETESPVAFTERLLATPLRVNLWNPKHDPISERRYVDYMRRGYTNGVPVRHAGLDWLMTAEARRDYMTYFAPPSNIMPFGDVPPTASQAASKMRGLADAAIEASFQE